VVVHLCRNVEPRWGTDNLPEGLVTIKWWVVSGNCDLLDDLKLLLP